MKHKKTMMIFDEKSNCEPVVLSRVKRKPGTVFVIVPFEYLGSTEKWFDLVAESMVKDKAVRRQPRKTGGHVA